MIGRPVGGGQIRRPDRPDSTASDGQPTPLLILPPKLHPTCLLLLHITPLVP